MMRLSARLLIRTLRPQGIRERDLWRRAGPHVTMVGRLSGPVARGGRSGWLSSTGRAKMRQKLGQDGHQGLGSGVRVPKCVKAACGAFKSIRCVSRKPSTSIVHQQHVVVAAAIGFTLSIWFSIFDGWCSVINHRVVDCQSTCFLERIVPIENIIDSGFDMINVHCHIIETSDNVS
jgi:hypothetical protein